MIVPAARSSLRSEAPRGLRRAVDGSTTSSLRSPSGGGHPGDAAGNHAQRPDQHPTRAACKHVAKVFISTAPPTPDRRSAGAEPEMFDGDPQTSISRRLDERCRSPLPDLRQEDHAAHADGRHSGVERLRAYDKFDFAVAMSRRRLRGAWWNVSPPRSLGHGRGRATICRRFHGQHASPSLRFSPPRGQYLRRLPHRQQILETLLKVDGYDNADVRFTRRVPAPFRSV